MNLPYSMKAAAAGANIGDKVMYALIAGYSQARTSGALSSKREFTIIGVDHFLSKRTDIHRMAHSDKPSTAGTGTSTGLGIKHVF